MRSSACHLMSRRRRWAGRRLAAAIRLGAKGRCAFHWQRCDLQLSFSSPPSRPPSFLPQLRKKRLYLKQRAEEARADASEGSVPIYAPDPALAPSFDPEVTGYRYKVLEDPTGIISR